MHEPFDGQVELAGKDPVAAGSGAGEARCVVFVLAGVFVLKAAVLSGASQAKGLDAVFRSVASSPAADRQRDHLQSPERRTAACYD